MNGRSIRFWSALGAFFALPGTVAFVIPWLLRPSSSERLSGLGIALVAAGSTALLWCVRDFYVAGRGTLAPWAPPERLVVVGLYRISRNPMYLAVLLVLVGWAVAFGSPRYWIYAGCVAIAFHLRVVRSEEPFLARAHSEEWIAYRHAVPRWLF